jgi:hypothetical protein
MSAAPGGSRPNDDQQWRDAIRVAHDESCGGVFDISIIDAAAWGELLGHVILGSRSAAMLAEAVMHASQRIRKAPRRLPSLCVCCPRLIRRVTPETVFGVAVPSNPAATAAVAFAFCSKCSADRAALPAKATEGLRRIWPDLRPITVTHPMGGCA